MKTSLLLHPQNGKDVLLLGEFPERSNGTDCKSAGYAFGGSNPSLPTSFEEADADFSHK